MRHCVACEAGGVSVATSCGRDAAAWLVCWRPRAGETVSSQERSATVAGAGKAVPQTSSADEVARAARRHAVLAVLALAAPALIWGYSWVVMKVALRYALGAAIPRLPADVDLEAIPSIRKAPPSPEPCPSWPPGAARTRGRTDVLLAGEHEPRYQRRRFLLQRGSGV
jgi:hypothetical protein